MYITLTLTLIIVIILAVAIGITRKRKKSKKVEDFSQGEATNKQIYIGNLSYQLTEQELKDYFGKYGVIEQVRIVRNYGSGRSKGFGFITYRTITEAKNALVAHGQKYKDRTIVVRIAKPR